MGTRSGARVRFCPSNRATGSARSAAGSHPAGRDGCTCILAARPINVRSATLGWGVGRLVLPPAVVVIYPPRRERIVVPVVGLPNRSRKLPFLPQPAYP